MIKELIKMGQVLPCNQHYLGRLVRTIESISRSTTNEHGHHIIPRCWGLDDSAENILRCSKREHRVLHLLYSKAFYEDDKLASAAIMMNKTERNSDFEHRCAYHQLDMTLDQFRDVVKYMVTNGSTVQKVVEFLGTTHDSIKKYCSDILTDDVRKANFRNSLKGPKSETHKQSMRKPKSAHHRTSLAKNSAKRTAETFAKGVTVKKDRMAQRAGYKDDAHRTQHIRQLYAEGMTLKKIAVIAKCSYGTVTTRLEEA